MLILPLTTAGSQLHGRLSLPEEHQPREDLEAMDNLEMHVNVSQICWALHPPNSLAGTE